MIFKSIYVDDEEIGHVVFKMAIKNVPEIKLVGEYLLPSEALNDSVCANIDVAFIDIEMPEYMGLELASKLQEKNTAIKIIFVTAYDQYALQAFKVNACDYLLKPINESEVRRVVGKLIKNIGHGNVTAPKILAMRPTIITMGRYGLIRGKQFRCIDWTTSKTAELFAYLLAHINSPVGKWVLCEVLWPESDGDKAIINLHSTIYRLKKNIKHEKLPIDIRLSSGCYQMNINNLDIDYVNFEKIAVAALNQKNCDEKALLAAEGLYTGEIFAEQAYLWSYENACRLNGLYLSVLKRIAEYYSPYSDDLALEYYKKIVDKFPQEERSVMKVVEILSKYGNKAALTLFYRNYEKTLRTQFDCLPSKQIHNLYNSKMKGL